MNQDWGLLRLTNSFQRPGPLVLVVLDGIALGKEDEGNAVHRAFTPTFEYLNHNALFCQLQAHGMAVGLPSDDDMGNSEVGHNALGAGRVYAQGAKRVNQAIANGQIFQGETWKRLIKNCQKHQTPLHLMGLLSDGNVHSHIEHLFALIRRADQEEVTRVYVHALLDGRDVGSQSALKYIRQTEEVLAEINAKEDRHYAICSGGGRMVITMDRYEADWEMVKKGWDTHVLGKAREFSSAQQAIETFREENPEVGDQFLPPFVITSEEKAIGTIDDNHSVIFYNFRGDRAIEISRCFEEKDFDKFDRERFPDVSFAGMMRYDGDRGIPGSFLVDPPFIEKTWGEYLAKNSIPQFAVSETQKYGHVTYFWNGNRSGKFVSEYETYQEIASDRIPFEQRPWMKAAEITDAVEKHLSEFPQTRLVRINYPNGDMVGHTGDMAASIIAVEAVDLSLKRLLKTVRKNQGIALVLADHGNADEMYERDKQGNFLWDDRRQAYSMRTSHSLNPVPCWIYDPGYQHEYRLKELEHRGLTNIAATALNLLGYQAPDHYDPSLISFDL